MSSSNGFSAPPQNPATLGSTTSVGGQSVETFSLPADQQAASLPGNVNYLGSTYSGADIKVLVHMYGAVFQSAEEESIRATINQLEIEIQDYQTILSQAASLTSIFSSIRSAALNQIQSGRIKSNIITLTSSQPNPDIRVSVLNQYASESLSSSTAERGAWQSELNKFQEIRQKAASTMPLGTLQTISVQSSREKVPVRALGTSYVKGHTRGPRTIAGSMIFTLFDEASLAALIRAMGNTSHQWGEMFDGDLSSLMIDQLPPIDVTIVFTNEYGSLSKMSIYGVEFINNGVTLSIEDLISEEVVNYVARDMDEMVKVGDVAVQWGQRRMFGTQGQDLTGSNLLIGNADRYNDFLEKLKVRRRFVNR